MLRKFLWLICVLISAKVFAQVPVISSFSPTNGTVGTLVTINGSNLAGNPVATFGNIQAANVSVDASKIVCMIMPGTTTASLKIKTDKGNVTGNNFTVFATPIPNNVQGNKLVGTNSQGTPGQGGSVAVSADGKTAIVAGPTDNNGSIPNGACWIYTLNGDKWEQQGPKLQVNTTSTSNSFGNSVALSADGNTAAIGGLMDNGTGGVWIFVRNNGIWAQQGTKLVGTPANAGDEQGAAIALSADGNTLVETAYSKNVFIFKRNTGSWSQTKTLPLLVTESVQQNLAINADASVIAVQVISYPIYKTLFFEKQGNDYVKTAELPVSGYLALSADGNRLMIGNKIASSKTAANVYDKVNGQWIMQSAAILPAGLTNLNDFQYTIDYCKIRMSADGTVAAVSLPWDASNSGATWIFQYVSGNWVQQNAKILPSDSNGSEFGSAIGLSADGATLIVGGSYDNSNVGAVWFYGAAPITNTQAATDITTSSATLNGIVNDNADATTVNLEYSTADDMTGATTATLSSGSNPITTGAGGVSFSANLTGLTSATTYYYRINGINKRGNTKGNIVSFSTLALPPSASSFSPAKGPAGTLITVNGNNLSTVTTITMGGLPMALVSKSFTRLTALVTPGTSAGNIIVNTPAGTATLADNFTVIPTSVPNLQTGGKLLGTNGSGFDGQGGSVALSADGSTAIVGGSGDINSVGAAWIYVRNGNTWVQQGSKLVGTGFVDASQQGLAVALSADGNTAAVGGARDNYGFGAVWIFTRTNGVWTQQGSKLLGTSQFGYSQQGSAVSLSADGNRILVGASFDNNGLGAALVFNRNSKGVWTQDGGRLIGTGSNGKSSQGASVSLSADGNTALIGGPDDIAGINAQTRGAAWIFVRVNGVWVQQGNKMVSTDGSNRDRMGCSVAISTDGNTAVLGGGYYYSMAWVFKRTAGVWTQQGGYLQAGDTQKFDAYAFGPNAVTVSADGNVITVGASSDNQNNGAVWTFVKNGSEWLPSRPKFYGADVTGSSSQTGSAVSMSADGNIMMFGAIGDNGRIGASWIYQAAPNVETLPSTLITTANATLNGTVDDNGNLTTVEFEYGTTADLSANTIIVNPKTSGTLTGGTGKTGFQADITGLKTGATYYYRVNAVNVNGKINGNVIPFTTIAGPPAITSISPFTGQPGTLVTINGTNLNYSTNIQIGQKKQIIVSNTSDKIVLMVAPGTTSGAVSVTTLVGAASGASFSVTETPFPYVQQGDKLVSSGAPSFQTSYQARSLSISADGNTLVEGCQDENVNVAGSFYIFTRANGSWKEQTRIVVSKISLSYAMALNADGTTLLISGASKNQQQAISVYTNTNGVWSVQAQLTTPESIYFGNMARLSADGNTAIVTGVSADCPQGAAWMFTRTGTVWTQRGAKIPFIADASGNLDVALSADGYTLITGHYANNNYQGVVQVFFRIGDVWNSQGGLKGNDVVGNAALFGTSVALSADGNMAVVGGPGDYNNTGAAWVFKRINGTWIQQGKKLLGIGLGAAVGPDHAKAVAISADGSIIMTAADRDLSNATNYGAMRVFKQVGDDYVQQGLKLKANISDNNGFSIMAFSADGTTVATDNPYKPAVGFAGVYVFVNTDKPNISYFTPSAAGADTPVLITGLNFTGTTAVSFGGTAAKSFVVNSPTSITAIVNKGSFSGNVVVVAPTGTVSAQFFNFIPAPVITVSYLNDGTATLTSNLGSPQFTVQWFKDGVAIANTNNNSITASINGTYTVSITSGGATQTSDPAIITLRFVQPVNNFTTSVTSLTCKGSNSGIINIVAKQSLNYTATLTGNGINKLTTFTTNCTFDNLAAGSYNVCITVAGQGSYQQCYTLNITEPKDLALYSTIVAGGQQVTLNFSGGSEYHILLNGKTTNTKDTLITLPLIAGTNKLIVTTDRACQGIVEKSFVVADKVLPYPDPFENDLYINMGVEKTSRAIVKIYSVFGQLVYQKRINGPSANLWLDVSTIKISGVYSLQLTTDTGIKIFKIIKK